MNEIKNEFSKVWWSSLATSIIFVVIGILLMIYPTQIITVISMAVGIGIIIAGIFAFIRYYRNNKDVQTRNYFRFDIVYGAICVVAGTLLIVNTKAMVSILPLVLGIWMAINSIVKIQYTLTIRQMNKELATPMLVLDILTLACGILFIFNPFSGMEILTQILGAVIAIYAILDIVNATMIRSRVKTAMMVSNEIIVAGTKRVVEDDVEEATIIEEKPRKKKNKK